MPKNENTVKRSQGEHLKKKEVKTKIISYILSENGVVSGPDIIKYLRNKFNVVDEKNIRKHLKDLQKQRCIEIIQGKPGFENKWKIENIENLWNIKENYLKKQLNTYDKSIDIILEEQIQKGYLIKHVDRQEFRIQLCLSVSFFNMCLEKDIGTIFDTAYKMFQYGEGYEEYNQIRGDITTFYINYIARISINPEIWLDVYKENIDNVDNIPEVEACFNSIIALPNVKVNPQTFQEIFETTHLWRVDVLVDWEPKFVKDYAIKMADLINSKMLSRISSGSKKWNYDLKVLSTILEKFLSDIPDKMPGIENYLLLKELSVKISYEIFQKMFNEIPAEFLDVPDNICKILSEVLIKIFQIVIQEMRDFPEEVQDIPEERRVIPEKAKEYQEQMQECSEERRKYLEEFREYQEGLREYQEEIQRYEEEIGEYEEEEEELILDMDMILGKIFVHQDTIRFSIHQVMFEHCFHKDIEEGIDTNAEREYVIIMRKLQARLKEEIVLSKRDTFTLDRFYENYMKKRKEKSKSQ